MLRAAASLALAMIAFGAIVAAQSPEPRGTITVKVIDPQGKPVSGATVKMEHQRRAGFIYKVFPSCTTDASGECTCNYLPTDTYTILASAPSEGYPDLTFAFYGRQIKRVVVVLTPGSSIDNAVFQLGPKAARLKLAILDDATGAPIGSAAIVLRDASDNPDWLKLDRDLDSNVLITPEQDVLIEVIAKDYESWRLSDHLELTGGRPLHLHSDERREMTIRLKHK